MKFSQIIEFETSRIDEFNAHLDAWDGQVRGASHFPPGGVEEGPGY